MPNQAGSGLPNIQNYTISTVLGDEVVQDNVTGLMWQRRASDQRFTWGAAVDYCDGLTLGGATDWRLPSRIELVSLLDLSHTNPSIDPTAFPAAQSDWFWASSRQSDAPDRSWFAYFYFGYPDTDPQDTDYLARCVRSPAAANGSPGGPRYVLQPEVAADPKTHLSWQRAIPVETQSLTAAEQYCADLNLAGKTDWRLPSLQEMQTIVDEGRANPAIDSGAFPATPARGFWTATRWAGTPELAWHVDFDRGSAAYDTATTLYRVRCARWEP